MDKNRFFELADNPDFIPGIYNYCDRWCKYCRFKTKCMNYVMENEFFPEKDTVNVSDEEFWRSLEDFMKLTHDVIAELAERKGLDLDQLAEDEKALEHERQIRLDVENDPIVLMSLNYQVIVTSLVEKILRRFNLNLTIDQCVDIEMMEGIDTKLGKSIEVICYFKDFMKVKISRALLGKIEDDKYHLDFFVRDRDGNAKAALNSIDRSIEAWTKLIDFEKNVEDEVLDILVFLSKIKKNVLVKFPNAPQFIRPGFDE